MWPVERPNTRISTGYAQKIPPDQCCGHVHHQYMQAWHLLQLSIIIFAILQFNCKRHVFLGSPGAKLQGRSSARGVLGIIGRGPSDSKSNRLHVDIFRFYFNSFQVYSTDSSKIVTGEISAITGWDPSVCKSSRLHVDILRFSFVKLEYIL